jgi:DNA polymerase-3 subunit beta
MIEIVRKPFHQALAFLDRNSTRVTNTVLVKADAATQKVTLEGGYGDLVCSVELTADVSKDVRLPLPLSTLSSVTNAMTGDTVRVEADAEKPEARVLSGSTRTVMALQQEAPAGDFERPDSYPVQVDAQKFRMAVERAGYAAARESYAAHIMRGMLLEIEGLACSLVATDGFRLARFILELEDTPQQTKVIVPAKALQELARVCDNGTLELAFDGNKRMFARSGGYYLTLALAEGSFPEYARIIPGQFQATFETDAGTLREALTRVAVMSDRNSNRRVDVEATSNGELVLRSEGPFGTAQEIVNLEKHEGEPVRFPVNSDYLQQALHKLDGTARLQIAGGTAPFIVSQAGSSAYLGLIVPLRDA